MEPTRVLSSLRRLALASVLALAGGAATAEPGLVDALIPYARQDYVEAERLLRPLALKGDAVAQLILGRMHLRGEGRPKNSFVAIEWHRKAAEQGNADAQYEIGVMLRDGVGTFVDGQLALKWFERAARSGAPAALNAIGELYLGHQDISKNYQVAFEWFTKGAELEDPQAMYNLGLHYALGRAGEPDELLALMWFDLAAGFGGAPLHENAVRARIALAERMTPLQVWKAKVQAQRWKQSRCCFQLHLSNTGTADVSTE